MKSRTSWVVVAVSAALVLGACSDASNPVSGTFQIDEESAVQHGGDAFGGKASTQQSEGFYTTSINDTWVTFQGGVYDATADATTFSYQVAETVSGPDNIEFSMDIPSCTGSLVAYSPTNGVSLNSDPNTGVVNGIDWHPGTPVVEHQFSVTFEGDVPWGVVDLAVRSGSEHGAEVVAPWYGPCAGELYSVSGKVFVDEDGDGVSQEGDPGIDGLGVALANATGSIGTATVADGNYTFSNVIGSAIGGLYTINGPTAVPGYAATTPSTYGDVDLSSNVSGYDFGFIELFDISGVVFIDTDEDGVLDASESGIGNVSVQLNEVADCESGTTVQTGASGAYLFTGCVPTAGYEVSVPLESVSVGDFNSELGSSFTATTPLSITVDPQSNVADFGFNTDAKGLTDKFAAGTITSAAENLKWWTKEVRAAKTGSRGALHTAKIQGYLDEIETLYLPDPFAFDDANEVLHALHILTEQPKNPYDLLLKQLLTAELNYVSGRGITAGADPDLLPALIAWGETVVVENPPTAGKGGGEAGTTAASDVGDAYNLFSAFNSSGGGGGGGNE